MPSSFALNEHFESFIRTMVASGRYNNASEVVRDGLRALEDRERMRERDQAELEALLAQSLDDIENGRMQSAGEVLDRLSNKRAARKTAAE